VRWLYAVVSCPVSDALPELCSNQALLLFLVFSCLRSLERGFYLVLPILCLPGFYAFDRCVHLVDLPLEGWNLVHSVGVSMFPISRLIHVLRDHVPTVLQESLASLELG
jgi:hypothetical protein